MTRRPGKGAPEARVERQVRARLRDLGFEEADWEEEARVVFFPGREGSADFLVKLHDVPTIVVEAEGRAEQFDDGFLQARAYWVMLNPERPVPYLMVVAGSQEGLFRAELPPSGGPGVRYTPVDRLLTKEELLDAVGAPTETFTRDVALLDRFVTLFQRLLRAIQTGRGLEGERGLLALAGWLRAEVGGDEDEVARVYADYRIAQRIQRDMARLLEPHGNLQRYEGWALGYAFRQVVRPFFRGGDYGRYFTPPEVIRFMVEVAAPKPGSLVLDPTCGSGGFLGRIALDWLVQGVPAEDITPSLIGCDHDELCVAATATFLELLLPGRQEKVRVYRKDSLTTEKRLEWEEDLSGLLEDDSFDLVIGNPPAGRLPEQFRESVADYEFVARQALYEVAFLERALRLTRPGGTVALILPEGLFANARMRVVRAHLVRETTLDMIVSLPRGVFPFTPSKMCVLLLRKARPPREQYVLMAEVSERAKISEELEEIAAFYREGRQAHG